MSIIYKIKKFFKSAKKLLKSCISDDNDNIGNIVDLIDDAINVANDTKDVLEKIEDGITEIIGIADDISSSL